MPPHEPPPRVSVYPNRGGVVAFDDLNPNDILSGRSKTARFRPGNVAFRTVLARGYVEEYTSSNRREKNHVAARLVEEVRQMDPPGRFLRECEDGYVEIGDEKAWKKAVQVLRDASGNNSNIAPPLVRNITNLRPRRNIGASKNNNSLPSTASLPHRGRLVIIRPSSGGYASRQRGDADECGQWPLYQQLCRTYEFAVDVEQLLKTTTSFRGEDSGNSKGTPSRGVGGPRTNLVLVDNGKNGKDQAKRDPLQCISERLIVRPRESSSNAASNASLHPELKEGDVILTLDGKPDPTFAVLYAMMCRREKLVLEVVGENDSKSGGEVERKVAVAEEATARGGLNARAATIHVGLNVIGTRRRVSNGSGSKPVKGRSALNSNKNDKAMNCSRSEVTAALPNQRPSRWAPKGRVAASEMMDLTLSDSDQKSKSLSSQLGQSVSTSLKTAFTHQQKRNTNDEPSMQGDRLGNNAYKRKCRQPYDRDGYYDEAALFDVVDQQLNEQHEKQQDERLRVQSRHESVRNAHATKVTPAAASAATNTGDDHSQSSANSVYNAHAMRTAHAAASFAATVPVNDDTKLSTSNDGSVSQIACIKPSAAAATATDNPLCSGEKVVNISSSSSPTNFDCVGNCDDPISLPSSSDSSSSSSDSDSSSTSDSDSDSNSSSASDSSSSSDRDNGMRWNQKPELLRRKNSIQSLQSCNATRSSTNLHRPILAVPSAVPLAENIPNNPMNNISIKLNHEVLASKLPPPEAPRNRPLSKGNTSASNKTDEPPTSLSRLWPDPSDVIKALTRWQPPIAALRMNSRGEESVEFHGPIQCHKDRLENERNNPLLQHALAGGSRDVPQEFKNVSEMMEAMAHPLMNEGLCQINGEYHAEKYGNGKWNRDLYHLRLSKLTEVEPIFQSKSYFYGNIKMYEAQFSAHGETNLPPSNLSELYCIHFSDWQDSKFGVVAHDFPTTITFRKYNEGKAFLKLWLVVHPNERDTKQTGWLSQNEFKKLLDPHKNGLVVKQNANCTLMSCGSTTNIVRQFEAIKCLPYLKPHLQKALFTSYVSDTSNLASSSTKPRSLPIDIWRHLSNSHNSLQLSSISLVLTGSCRNNICLLHGPPGTGKSSTIVGLVSALLSGKAPLPNQRQSGCLIHPGKTMGATYAEPQARNRILVCAATNQAVDSLAWKIKQGSLGPSGKVGDFVMARFGSLPWDLSRDSTDQKPETLSEMEDFLYEINVDRRASDEMQDFEYDHDPQEEVMCWSPEKRKPKRRKRRKIVGRAKLRSRILGGSSVVLTTLSGAGSKAFIDAVCRDPTRNDSEFDAVVIDEACQASEPESLIPFKYNPTTITLVGDPKQLPVLTLSGSSPNNKLFERSLFERLQSLNFPTTLLRKQYRMHEVIAAFPSEQFYQGKLITPGIVRDRPEPPWTCPCFPTLCFWDLNERNMTVNPLGHGFANEEETDFIAHTILSTLAHAFLKRSDVEVTVGIISFYRDQVKLIKERLAGIPALNNSRLKVKVATVDGFQGSECDIIVLSCVRSHLHLTKDGQRRGSIGFLNDHRRVNVALTRAKCSLWIVGNAEVLEASDLWRKLIQHLKSNKSLRGGDEFQDIFAQWMAYRER